MISFLAFPSFDSLHLDKHHGHSVDLFKHVLLGFQREPFHGEVTIRFDFQQVSLIFLVPGDSEVAHFAAFVLFQRIRHARIAASLLTTMRDSRSRAMYGRCARVGGDLRW